MSFKCTVCGEELSSAKGLSMHNKQRHGNADIAQATAAVSAMKTTSWADDVSDDEDGAPAPVAKPAAAPQPAAAKPAAAPQPAAVEPAVEASEPAGPPVDASEVLQTLVHTLSEVEVKLAEQQADSKSPLFSAHTFEELELSPELLKGVYSMGFNRPSKIQERALPLLLRNGPNGRPRNVIAQSQSGTGKTAAFVITCLSRVDASLDTPQALILAPARELAVQTNEVLKGVGKFTTVKSCLAVAGRRHTGTIKEQIVVGTPGSILELMQRRFINLSTIKVFVLDEADQMMNIQGLGEQSMVIYDNVRKASPECQVLFFSATYPDAVSRVAKRMVSEPNMLYLKREQVALGAIRQYVIRCKDEDEKMSMLSDLYGLLTVGSSMIFCNRIDTAQMINDQMNKEGYTVSLLTGRLDSTERDRVMDDFCKGKSKVLVSTNVLARGIDVAQVSLVINFDVPTAFSEDRSAVPVADYETYIHRIGRTGRFGRSGVAINMVDSQVTMGLVKDIERFYSHPIAELPVDLGALEAILQNKSS